MRKKTIDALIELGVPANMKGFHYICDAMEIYAADETYLTAKTCRLYQEIAEKHATVASKVEKCMRHAFDRAVTYGNLDSLNAYMTAAQKPTNGNLLACLYLKLKYISEPGKKSAKCLK